ncbi:MAG: hypothetical protein DI616_15730 [Paracoccus denitrificans]|uniref:Uncharacterized protein n=1 Tax=Paracoccus denitrificans TaxID=266 RepID=A0A533I0F5_PARDE|nr:MAG: hypothetical protein DI616_15730 [Paracoccus denitrificans]
MKRPDKNTPKDVAMVTMSSAKLRAMLHEAWKNGNDSDNIHTEPAGESERHKYVSRVMIEKGFKEPWDRNEHYA